METKKLTVGYKKDTYRNAEKFFQSLAPNDTYSDLSVVCVMHLVPGTRIFFSGLSKVANVPLILAKPKSKDENETEWLEGNGFSVFDLCRERFADSDFVVDLLNEHVNTDKLIIVDIGGYFASHLDALKTKLNSRLIGIIEDTENGHKRYSTVKNSRIPLVSVARSELKNSEDFLVGQSIVFSAEAILRDFDSILNGRKAVVMGYGKIGRSIALHLRSRHITTTVVETNPVRAIEAKAHGFSVMAKMQALQTSNLIFCATGNRCLEGEDFDRFLTNGSYIISVTSADDELNLDSVSNDYVKKAVSDHIEVFERQGHYFYLVNKGNAVNFVHKGRLGAFIYPVQGELMRAVLYLYEKDIDGCEAIDFELEELPESIKLSIAQSWSDCFKTVHAD